VREGNRVLKGHHCQERMNGREKQWVRWSHRKDENEMGRERGGEVRAKVRTGKGNEE